MFRTLGLVALATVGLAGCAASDRRAPSDEEICRAYYGLPPGSGAFADCLSERRKEGHRLGALLMSDPNAIVPIPPPPDYRPEPRLMDLIERKPN